MAQVRKQFALFPDIPRDLKMVKPDGDITDHWKLYFEQLTQALQSNLKPEGFVIPPKTTSEIGSLTGTTSNNNIIYDSTVNAFKGNVNGTWKIFLS